MSAASDARVFSTCHNAQVDAVYTHLHRLAKMVAAADSLAA
jgi:hypothetical protein